MKPKTFLALLAVALILFGLFWGNNNSTGTTAFGEEVNCGTPFYNDPGTASIHDFSAEMRSIQFGTRERGGGVTACIDQLATDRAITFASLIVGGIGLIAILVVRPSRRAVEHAEVGGIDGE